MAKKEIPQDIDGASAGRKFKKNEPGMPEQLGSAIRVDGKPLKPDQTSSGPSIGSGLKPERNYKPMFDKARAESEAREESMSNRASRMNEMGDSYKNGGKVGSASSRADGIAMRGKTKGTMVMCGGGYAKGKR